MAKIISLFCFVFIHWNIFSMSFSLLENLNELKEKLETESQLLNTMLNTPKVATLIQTQEMLPHLLWEKLAKNKNSLFNKKKLFKQTTELGKSENQKIPQKTIDIFRIMTYNVHFWKNPEATEDTMDSIFSTISNLSPDVIIIQELSPKPGFGEGAHFKNSSLEQQLINLGYNYIAGCNTLHNKKNQWFGNIIASKYPANKSKRYWFNKQYRPTEERCFNYMEIELPINKKIGIFGTHLEVNDKTDEIRFEQINEILNHKLNTLPNTLIAADFNSIRKQDYQYQIDNIPVWNLVESETQKALCISEVPTKVLDQLAETGYIDSFAQINWQGPKFTNWTGTVIDFIMLGPNWNLPLAGSYIYYDAASDHVPIIMDIKLD